MSMVYDPRNMRFYNRKQKNYLLFSQFVLLSAVTTKMKKILGAIDWSFLQSNILYNNYRNTMIDRECSKLLEN